MRTVTIDPMTGVYSRATLESRLSEEVQRALRYGQPFSLLLLDLDHFKSVNDAFGHLRGDQVLAEFAQRLLGLIRKSDLLFRYGGDEFLILLPMTNQDQAVQLTDRLLFNLRTQPFSGQPSLNLSLSIGVASCPQDADTPEDLFEKADERHYEAKRRGRNRAIWEDSPSSVHFFEDERLIERDAALTDFHAFLKQLPGMQRGLLCISGPTGVGRGRFLSEIGKIARLQNYEVISLTGTPASRSHAYGEINRVCQLCPGLPLPAAGAEAFGQAWKILIESKKRSGLIFCVDQLGLLDWPSLELLRRLLFHVPQAPAVMGLLFTGSPVDLNQIFPILPDLTVHIELRPFSSSGIHLWLRSMLHWEAPAEMDRWLYQATGGLAGSLKTVLTKMLVSGILERQGDGWCLTRALSQIKIQPPEPPAITWPTQLPHLTTPFIGRQDELQRAIDLLHTHRLLTLIGPGGIGKTRLAIQIAAQLTDTFPDSVHFVPLAAVNSSDFLITAIAEALGLSPHTHAYTQSTRLSALLQFLKTKRLLLVLDNFEHLSQAATLLSQILYHAPEVHLLVTSRERIHLHHEALLELTGMSVPEAESDLPAEVFPAIQLFVQSARCSDPGFLLTPDIQPHVIHICQMVEGLPLGIELAASWLRTLSCAEIEAELATSLDFLAVTQRDLPERHRSLRAVFEHSWNLLTPDEQNLFKRLSVFKGGFQREAASQVLHASVQQIATLLDKTLLRKTEQGRYEMHEVLHQYAHEKLQQDPEVADTACAAHSRYYCYFLQEQKDLLAGNQPHSLANITAELDNLQAAWKWAYQHGRFDWIQVALPTMCFFYELRGLFQEGDLLLSQVEEAFNTAQLPPDEAEPGKRLKGLIFVWRGIFKLHLGQYQPAQEFLEEGLSSVRQLDLLSEIAFTLQKLGRLYEELGEYAHSRVLLQESLVLYRQVNDPLGIGRALNELGVIAYQLGEYPLGETLLQECLRIFRDLEDRWGVSNALINLGNVEAELGEYHKARRYYEESLALCQELGALGGMASLLNNMGDISRETGNYADAIENFDRSITLYTQIGDRAGQLTVLNNLTDVAYRQHEYVLARQYLEQSLTLCNTIGNPLFLAYTLAQAARLSIATGELYQARQDVIQALELSMQNRAGPLVMEVLVSAATLLVRLEENETALNLLNFISRHPATMKEQRQEVENLQQELLQEISKTDVPEDIPVRPLEEVIHEIVTILSQ